MLRRFHSLLVILALLASPLALYARGAANDMADCGGMCCLPHGHHAPAHHNVQQPAKPSESTADCHHAAAASATSSELNCALECAMHPSPRALNFGLLAPLAPTRPSGVASLPLSSSPQSLLHLVEQSPATSVALSLFRPPRA